MIFFLQTVISLREILLFLVFVLTAIPNGQADDAVFYDESNYQGSTFTLGVNGGCYNFKRKWKGRVSSVQVQPDSCMIAWNNEACSGKSIKLMPNTKETVDLRNVGFDKKMKSVSLCTEISFRPMDVEDRMWKPSKHDFNEGRKETGNTDTHHGVKNPRVELNFYDEPNFRGSGFTLTSNGDCYNFKPKWINRISSLDSGGRCIKVWNKPNCEGVAATLSCDNIEEFKNLNRVRFNKRIQSAQLCTRPVAEYDNENENTDENAGQDDSRSRNSNDNRGINPSATVNNNDMATDEEVRDVTLSEHNKLRRLHGVPDLIWDSKMQLIAQDHAEWLASHNKFQHSTNDDLGENIGGISTASKIDAIKDSIHLWYNEIKHYNFDNPGNSVLGIKAGHFTQLVWKTTTHLGLGVAWNAKRQWYVVVCNYSPPGNFKGDYKKNVLPPIRKEK